MHRTIALFALCSSACAVAPDTRPETADYIIEAVLVPYCGRGGCHSTNTAVKNLIFDTIAGAHASMTARDRGQILVVPGDPEQSRLFTILSDSNKIMPPDIPLPDKDIALISRWITDGADGL